MKDTSSDTSSSFDTPLQREIHYDDFFGPLFFEPYAIEVARRIADFPASMVVELAAGTGRVTRHIRKSIPQPAILIASDISDDMLTVAKIKLKHLAIDWKNVDAAQLPFKDNSIDLVICCFGYMFVPDKTKAFAEVYRVLKPGGQFLFTTWDKLEENAASYTSVSVAKKYLEEPLTESDNLATSMSDRNVISGLLQVAGFLKVAIERVQLFSVCPTAEEAAIGFIQGGSIYGKIKKRNPEKIKEIKTELEKELAAKFGAAPMIAPISALITRAFK
ncbi:MAG: methyltransferase domain-containing protein [Chitinophagaceae bacterium]|nr:MAG: methyltransferase domain-containing protein [Chitinophagaceae bacterium]